MIQTEYSNTEHILCLVQSNEDLQYIQTDDRVVALNVETTGFDYNADNMVGAKEDADILDLTNSEVSAIAYALFATIRNKDLKKSCEIAEMMMLEYGLSGREVIAELKEVIKREYNDEYITVILSDTDFSLCTAQNEYLQINAMIARIITEVFDSE